MFVSEDSVFILCICGNNKLTKLDNTTKLLIGASLSEPHTSGTTLQDAYVREAIYGKFKLNERKRSLVPGAEEERLVHTFALPVN